MNVWEFLSPAERTAVKGRTFSIDVAPSLQRAIDICGANTAAIPDGVLSFPAGSYRIGEPLRCPYPIRLVGAGQRPDGGGVHAPTELIGWGPMPSVVTFGGAAQNVGCGGVERMKIDGRGLADTALEIVDVESCDFSRLLLLHGKKAGLYLHNTPEQGWPTAFLDFRQIDIITRAGSTPNAHGILIDGTCAQASDSQGVASCTWTQILCEHEYGSGVYIGNVGDSMTWNYLQTFSTNPDSYGVAFVRTDPKAINGGHLFLGPVIGRMYIADPSNQMDTAVVNWDDTNTGLTPLFCGPGGTNITFMSRYGSVGGNQKTLGTKETIRHDSMKFLHWDSTAKLLFTEGGVWKTTGQVFDASRPGGAVRFAGAGNVPAAIYNGANSGITASLQPHLITTVSLADRSIYRLGFMDSLADPPKNGIYWEYDPTADPEHLRCICRRDGKQSAIVSAVGPSSDVATFAINVQQERVNFWSNGAPFIIPFFAGSQTDHIPQVPLNVVYQTVRGTMDVCDYKCGYNTERQ